MTRQRILACTICALAIAASTHPIRGQTPDTTSTRAFCLRAEPLPQCRWVPITDAVLSVPLLTTNGQPSAASSEGRDYKLGVRWSLGMMRNVAPSRAYGLSGTVSLDTVNPYPSVEARTRFWRGEMRGFVELSAGYTQKVLSPRTGTGRWVRGDGATASVAWSPSDMLALVTRGDVVFPEGGRRGAIFLGGQAGDYRAAIGAVIVAGFVWLAMNALYSD